MSWSGRIGTTIFLGKTIIPLMMFLIVSQTSFPIFMSPGPRLMTSSLPREKLKSMKGLSMKVRAIAPKHGNCGQKLPASPEDAGIGL